MHAALADFASPHPRFRHDIRSRIDEPLRALRPYLEPRPDDWAFLVDADRRLPAEQMDALLTRWFTRLQALVAGT